MLDDPRWDAQLKSVKGEVSPEEWETRVDLAAAYRLGHHFGWNDGVGNHISARVPGPDDHFLINPFGFGWGEITASSLVKVDVDGEIISDTDYDVNRAGFVIHSAIHRSAPHRSHVMHHHADEGAAVASLEDGLMFTSQNAMFFYDKIAYHDYEGVSVDMDEQERLVADLGDKEVMILRNHGLLTVGGSMAECFLYMYRLMVACRIQVKTLAMNRKIIPISEETLGKQADFSKEMRKSGNRILAPGEREWPMYKRLAARLDPGFAS